MHFTLYFFFDPTTARQQRTFVLLVVLPHCLDDALHLLPLPLGTNVVADALLKELEAPGIRI